MAFCFFLLVLHVFGDPVCFSDKTLFFESSQLVTQRSKIMLCLQSIINAKNVNIFVSALWLIK